MIRDDVSKAFHEIFDNDEKRDLIFDRLEQCKNSDSFIIQYWDEEVLIYDTTYGRYINWYKLCHVGRAFSTNVESYYELKHLFSKLYEDITEGTL